MSTLAVASSMTKILFFRRRARAKHINCLWPTLKLEPPSDTTTSSWPAMSCTAVLSWTFEEIHASHYITSLSHAHTLAIRTCSRLVQISSSLCCRNGSRLYLTLPLKSTGSWRDKWSTVVGHVAACADNSCMQPWPVVWWRSSASHHAVLVQWLAHHQSRWLPRAQPCGTGPASGMTCQHQCDPPHQSEG